MGDFSPLSFPRVFVPLVDMKGKLGSDEETNVAEFKNSLVVKA